MMNDLFSIGPFTIHGYGLMIGLGIIAAFWYLDKCKKKEGFDEEPYFTWIVVTLIFGLLGAKLMFGITEFENVLKDPMYLISGSGFVVYGGIILGVFVAWLFCKIKKINFLMYADTAFPAVALAQGFGRIGCFLAGCCYGIHYSGIGHIQFHNSAFAPNNVDLFPSQLMLSALDFIHFFILRYVYKKSERNGLTTAIYCILYSVGRFFAEYLRGDLERGSVGMFSTSQFISIGVVIVMAALLFIDYKKSRKVEID